MDSLPFLLSDCLIQEGNRLVTILVSQTPFANVIAPEMLMNVI